MEIISSRKNKNVGFMRQLLRERSERRKNGMFAVEGDHLCGELAQLSAFGEVSLFLYTEKAAEKYFDTVNRLCSVCRDSFCISDELGEYISDTKSSQGLFAAVPFVKHDIPENAHRVAVLDGVQDPGNVGTIIRTAEALGFDGVITVGACADVYSPKVLRSSMGSALRMPIEDVSADTLRQKLSGFAVYAAMLDDTAAKLGEERFPERTAVVIGSEGKGVSDEVAALSDKKLYIPISGAESLNAAVAAAIIMWEISKI